MRVQVRPGHPVSLDEAGTKQMTYQGLCNPRGRTFIQIAFNYILDAEEQNQVRMLYSSYFGITNRATIMAQVGLTVVELPCSGALSNEFHGKQIAAEFAAWAPGHHRQALLEEARKQQEREKALAKVTSISEAQTEGSIAPIFQSPEPAQVRSLDEAPQRQTPPRPRRSDRFQRRLQERRRNQEKGKKK